MEYYLRKMDNSFFNKRGDVSITILVIGVILICALAIFSFFSSTIQIGTSFIGIGLTEKLNSQIETKIFNKENPVGTYVEENTTEGYLFWSKQVLLFSAEYKSQP
jgi:hypothetical protein